MLRKILLIPLLLACSLAQAQSPTQIMWDQLIPEGWDPYELFDQYTEEEYNALSDEEYYELQKKAQEMLTRAPVVEHLDGKQVRIPGFVVPLEHEGTSVSQFLLVPYFGACIHTPPPPANQVIKGSLTEAYVLESITQPVWITGMLQTGLVSSKLGEAGYNFFTDVNSGYSMKVDIIEPYVQ